ncbi:hypothetical protein [Halovivax sp.]|uniref:hypothetical protein n=1 Tax=Halovivax sp. TaxID=1935978 RepID=UPI0025C3EBD0|nr:hypothetical protein [Halovivax sp.]
MAETKTRTTGSALEERNPINWLVLVVGIGLLLLFLYQMYFVLFDHGYIIEQVLVAFFSITLGTVAVVLALVMDFDWPEGEH